jgi:hypothetical protein
VFWLDSSSQLRVFNSTFADNYALRSGGVLVMKSLASDYTSKGQRSSIVASNVTGARNGAIKGGVQFVQLGTNATELSADVGLLVPQRGSATTDNCARIGANIASSPTRLLAAFSTGEVASQATLSRAEIRSGQELPAINVTVLDDFGQAFWDASFFSLVLRPVILKQGLALSVSGRVNVFGLFGSASFANSSIFLRARAGNYTLEVVSDDLFASYPSSRLHANLTVTILPCPTGRFVNQTSLSCDVCPVGKVSQSLESSECLAVPAGSYTVDGTSVRSCTDRVDDFAPELLALKAQQCSQSNLQVIQISVGILVPAFFVSVGGIFGVLFYRKKLRQAQLRARPWLVSSKSIEWIRKIGDGACGDVFICKYKETIVCVKRIRVDHDTDGEPALQGRRLDEATRGKNANKGQTDMMEIRNHAIQAATSLMFKGRNGSQGNMEAESAQTVKTHLNSLLHEEIKIHVTLRHPNIVMCMGAVIEPGNICLITEFMTLGSCEYNFQSMWESSEGFFDAC